MHGIKSDNLWRKGYTRMLNPILGSMCADKNMCVRSRLLLLVARLSLGYMRKTRTNQRLCVEGIAEFIDASPASVSREVRKLVAEKRLFKIDPQGYYSFYSLQDPGEGIASAQSGTADLQSRKADLQSGTADLQSSEQGGVAYMQSCQNEAKNTNAPQEVSTYMREVEKTTKHSLKQSLKQSLKASPAFKHISEINWQSLACKYEIPWLEARLQSYAERITRGPLAPDRLTAMLAEDWADPKHRPAKDFKREQEEDAKKRRLWEAERAADEGKPPPPELVAWRKKSRRSRPCASDQVKA